MELNQVKGLAAKVLGIGKTKIRIKNAEKSSQAMTREDVRTLIKQGHITVLQKVGVSRARARNIRKQKKKGGRTGVGTRKGTKKSRMPRKDIWMKKVRALRRQLNAIKAELNPGEYRRLYKMVQGGYFRDRGHLLLYVKEHGMMVKK